MLLAENETRDIDSLFIDRPSRVLFHWEYNRLEEDVIKGYCKDNLITNVYLQDILNIYYTSSQFTFDSLQAVVEQCNIFNGDNFEDIIDGLNIPLPSSEDVEIIEVTLDGVSVEYESEWARKDSVDVEFKAYNPSEEDLIEDSQDEGYHHVRLYDTELKSIINGVTTYEQTFESGKLQVKTKSNKLVYDFNTL